jgi:hypothetical protein
MQGRRNNINVYRTGMVLRMYRLVFVSSCFLFIFCKDDSEMLRLSGEKTIEFFHDVLQRNVTAAPIWFYPYGFTPQFCQFRQHVLPCTQSLNTFVNQTYFD